MEMYEEAKEYKDGWPLLKAGLFDGSFYEFEQTWIEFNGYLERTYPHNYSRR
jgi:hypothetical protein